MANLHQFGTAAPCNIAGGGAEEVAGGMRVGQGSNYNLLGMPANLHAFGGIYP